jgi:indole-3-glycerol phosphate synthase
MDRNHITSQAPGRVFLEKIVTATQARIAELKSRQSIDSLLELAKGHKRRHFVNALTANPPAIIAEIKKASPSRGLLRPDFDHALLASAYEAGGAAALSVVTEPEFFQGSDDWVSVVKATTDLPVLRKDFVLDPIQVAEAASLGADAILLIARILSERQLHELNDAAGSGGLDVLFEAHDETDIEKIATCDARLVGINARNLDSFEIDTGQFSRLRCALSDGVVAVAESGIDSPVQIRTAMQQGYSAFLIGESLVKSHDPAVMLRTLRLGVNR